MGRLARFRVWLIALLGGVPKTAAEVAEPHNMIARLWEDGRFEEARKLAAACYPQEGSEREAASLLIAVQAQDRIITSMKEICIAALSARQGPAPMQVPSIHAGPPVVGPWVPVADLAAGPKVEPAPAKPPKVMYEFKQRPSGSEMNTFQ